MLLVAFGCQPATDTVLPSQPRSGDDHFISAEQATQIAQTATVPTANARQMGGKLKKVKNQLVIDDADDKEKKTKTQPVFYIVNYEEGGYSVISADDRLDPVLAIVEQGPGLESGGELPGGLLTWMQSTKEQIQKIRKVKLTKKAKKGGRAGSSLVNFKDPLMRTRWSQSGGNNGAFTFNSNIPYYCTDPNLNGRGKLGCVGVAVAQIVAYWGMKNPNFKTPFNYDWTKFPMADNTGVGGNIATSEIARLMCDAAREVHTSYGCDASGATGTTRVVTAFKQYFGYAEAAYTSYNPNDVAANLNNGWPVILGGYNSNILWWGDWWGSAHSWVCDGYRSYQDEGNEYCYYDEYDSYQCYTPVTYRYQFYMNWGWTNGAYNGWFSSTNFGTDINGNAMPHNYRCNLDEVVIIHP